MKKQLLLAEKGEWDPFKLKIIKVSEEFLCNHYNQIFMRNKEKISNTPFITFLDGAKAGFVKEKKQ